MNLGKRQDSIAMFKQALEVDPDYQPARKMLAKLEGG
jgi:Tfp pilus assembly protein PilF